MSEVRVSHRWIVTSTWGQHHVMAENECTAEELAEDFLTEQGYDDPENMILDGLTEEYNHKFHGEWEGDRGPSTLDELDIMRAEGEGMVQS